jgi:hypothetical protein
MQTTAVYFALGSGLRHSGSVTGCCRLLIWSFSLFPACRCVLWRHWSARMDERLLPLAEVG